MATRRRASPHSSAHQALRGRQLARGRTRGPTGREELDDTLARRLQVIKMQPWLTLAGDASTDEIIQPPEDWIDGAGAPSFLVFAELLGVTNCAVKLQTGMGMEGPWTDIVSFTGASVTSVLVHSEGRGDLLAGFLRWKVDASAANWKTCFMLEATPDEKGGTGFIYGGGERKRLRR